MKLSRKNTLPLNRIEALSDGIFAIAMTILVLNISLPEKEAVQSLGLHRVLFNHLNEFIIYFMSFFLLGVFWMIQRKQMSSLVATDQNHMWLNIIMLMYICLVPFSASLQSTYNSDWVAAFTFSANMLIIALLFLFIWHYATSKNRLVSPEFSREDALHGERNTWIFIVVSTISMGASFFIPEYSALFFLLIPILKSILHRFSGRSGKDES
ncbi:TMEM175 family protein [Bacteroidota bacterium]